MFLIQFNTIQIDVLKTFLLALRNYELYVDDLYKE